MPKQALQGTVEEQAAQLYDIALEALGEGRYSAASRHLAEIERALPGFRDVPQHLSRARYAQREQRYLLLSSLATSIVFIVLARILGAQSELLFLAAGALGLLTGFFVGQLLFRLVAGSQRHSGPKPN